ncbi:hypothetical protein M569_09484, partial [Genlisea aurea]
ASLVPGVLIELLRTVDSDHKVRGRHRSVLLQVVAIVPAITGSDFWPDHGFFIKISDSSHSTYVSLSRDDDELILNNELRLGQFFYVDRLRSGIPVPVLVGIRPLPGLRQRHPFVGNPKDLMQLLEVKGAAQQRSSSSMEVSQTQSGKKKVVIREEKRVVGSRYMKAVVSKAKPDVKDEARSSSETLRRQSQHRHQVWIQSSSSNIAIKSGEKKHNTILLEMFNHLFSSTISRFSRDVKDAQNPYHTAKATNKQPDIIRNKHSKETIQWSSLPTALVKPGKGLIKRRNLASMVAAEAEKEANVASDIAKCLEMFADLISSATSEKPHAHFSKFYALQQLIDKRRITFPVEEENDGSIRKNSTQEKEKSSIKCVKSQGKSINRSPESMQQLTVSDRVEWSKENGGHYVREVLKKLTDEMRFWFMNFLDEAIDNGLKGGKNIHEKHGKESSNQFLEDDNSIALTLSQLKQATEWLDKIRSSSSSESTEYFERVDSLKKKLYSCLLIYADSAASSIEKK